MSDMNHLVAVCCSVLQCVAVCCSVLQCVHLSPVASSRSYEQHDSFSCSVLQCVTVCGSVLQCVAVCCSVLQRVAVCCSVWQCVHLSPVTSSRSYDQYDSFSGSLLQCVAVHSSQSCLIESFV